MPNLYPGIKPSIGNGRPYVLLFIALFLPFLVFAQPSISGFSPQSGPVGSTVTISGNNFSATPSANIVYFGSVKAVVTAGSSTSLSVTAPAGASYQPITVTTGGLTAYSAQPFITTFSDPGQFKPDAFTTFSSFSTDDYPQSIFNADFNGDGKPDLVEVNDQSRTVSVYLNTSTTGNISFTLGYTFTLPSNYIPISITAGDLDGDGKPEIVAGLYSTNKIAVFLNTSASGTTTFSNPVYYAAGAYNTAVKIADCNGDGKPEVISCGAVSNALAVFANNSTVGNISLGAKQDCPLGGNVRPYNFIVSDVDGDGKPDFVAVNYYANTVSVFQNTSTMGGGALAFYHDATLDFSVGNNPQDLTVGDIDGDGKPDLAVVNNSDATITLLQNSSTPGSFNYIRGTDVPTGTVNPGSPQALLMTDFDGDGKPDIACVNQYDGTVSIHHNISTLGTLAMDANVDYFAGSVPWALTAADLDGDGLPDLAIVDNSSSTVNCLRNKSSNEMSITGFTPTSGPAGTVVTITGTSFTGATAVTFGGVAASSFTVNSATSITATVGSGATGVVTVVAPAGSASLGTFTYGVPSPVITGFTPTSGSPGTTITINGSHFTGATSVSFGGATASSFVIVSDNQITAVVGNGATGNVIVKTGPGSGSLGTFTYVPPPVSITSFNPQSGTTGTTVAIKGHGFVSTQNVTFGGVAASSITVYGDTSIIAVVANGATGDVAVIGTGNTDSKPGFTYTAPPPPPPSNLITLSSFTPMNGSIGDTIHIYGSGLTTANSVTFGGTAAVRFLAYSDVEMIAIVGAGSTGFVRVANSTTSDSLRLFTYTYDSTKTAPPSFQLIQFNGAFSGSNSPVLQWQVRNDGSISNYVVERSSDSILFSVIGSVKSTRTNGSSHTYTYKDDNASAGTNWYRLKMQDTTASYSYSGKIKLQPVSQMMPVYPNPVKYGFFYIDIPDVNVTSQVRIVDMSGKQLQLVIIPQGTFQARINIPGLASGTYRISWTNGKRTASTTILVLPQ